MMVHSLRLRDSEVGSAQLRDQVLFEELAFLFLVRATPNCPYGSRVKVLQCPWRLLAEHAVYTEP